MNYAAPFCYLYLGRDGGVAKISATRAAANVADDDEDNKDDDKDDGRVVAWTTSPCFCCYLSPGYARTAFLESIL
jgi:pyrrolidone-carboxylate peptidase